jgi:hypothetical protein
MLMFKKSDSIAISLGLLSALVLGLAAEVAIASKGSAIEPQKQKQSKGTLPPPPPNPGSTAPGGRRDNSTCPQDTEKSNPVLTAFSPTTGAGLTLAKQPTILVYVPLTQAQTGEFSLSNPVGGGIYRTTVALRNTPGIVRIQIPTSLPPLEPNQDYQWSFAIVCNPQNRFQDRIVMGEIRRTELSPTQMQQIQQAIPSARIALYQSANIWYDAIATIFELRRDQPNNTTLDITWKQLLQSAGLSAIAPQPVREIQSVAK